MIEIRNVSKSYDGKKKAIDNITFNVDDGCIFAFIGHNGAGKTTLIKSIMGIHDFDNGEIIIYDATQKNFLLLDPLHRIQTELSVEAALAAAGDGQGICDAGDGEVTVYVTRELTAAAAALILDTVRSGAGLPAECVRIAVF